MQRERVADDIFVFTSSLYAQVTAGAVVTSDGAILIDTLAFPEETQQIKYFLEQRMACPVRVVINTHYHADHTYGTYLFDNALVAGHALCREYLDSRGRKSIEEAQRSANEFSQVHVVLPSMVFRSGTLTIHVGNKTVELRHSPGHSLDSITCLVKEDRVLFAADTLMPVPYFVDGDYDAFIASLEALRGHAYESVVQGHGEVVLRGEVESKLSADLEYLARLRRHVERAMGRKNQERALERISIESCGKSRIPLNGAVQDLHKANVRVLYKQLKSAFETSGETNDRPEQPPA